MSEESTTKIILKNYILPLMLLVILSIAYLFIFAFETYTIPDWNKTTSEDKYPFFVVITLNLLINSFLFSLLSKKANLIPFILHFLISLSLAFFIRFPAPFLNTEEIHNDPEKLIQTLKMIGLVFLFFIITQIVFAIYIIVKFKQIRK